MTAIRIRSRNREWTKDAEKFEKNGNNKLQILRKLMFCLWKIYVFKKRFESCVFVFVFFSSFWHNQVVPDPNDFKMCPN